MEPRLPWKRLEALPLVIADCPLDDDLHLATSAF
jgi:hypothetical protein